MNIPLKCVLTYLYFATIEPLTIFSGYYANHMLKKYEENTEENK
jgi:hypothetical protein